MAKKSSTREELIKCEYCGEMYAASYKHCPFCNEDGTGSWDDPDSYENDEYEDDDLPVRGGRRLANRSRSGNGPSVGRIISWLLSLALIIAAAGIVISLVKPLLGGGKTEPDPVETTPAVESVEPTVEPEETVQPTEEPSVQPTETPEPTPTPTAGVQTPSVDLVAPTSFKLNKEDISFFNVNERYQLKATLTPSDAYASVVWKSSDPAVASVSETGMVTALSKGTVTVTATIEGLGEKSCIVRCSLPSGGTSTATPAPSTSSAPATSSKLALNREDFTLSHVGETWKLEVSGSSSAVTWNTSDSSIATVSGDGTVTAVSKGTCRVTATVDGVTLKCIVRCNFD